MDVTLSTSGLSVRYGGIAALDSVSLDVPRGSFVGVIGPNGAGKTTFIDAISGFVASRGTLQFDGRRIDGLRSHQRAARGLARTFQSTELFDELTVRENVLIPAEPFNGFTLLRDMFYPARDKKAEASVDAALSLLGIDSLVEKRPTEISLGQRKLVTVARALSGAPKLLLLDEPAAGLSGTESLTLGVELKKVVQTGMSIVLVDHDMGLVLNVCDYIYVLDFGKIVASGTPSEIAQNPTVIDAYLGA